MGRCAMIIGLADPCVTSRCKWLPRRLKGGRLSVVHQEATEARERKIRAQSDCFSIEFNRAPCQRGVRLGNVLVQQAVDYGSPTL